MASFQLLLIAAALCYCTLFFQCSTAAPVTRSLLQSEMRLLQERASFISEEEEDRHNVRVKRSSRKIHDYTWTAFTKSNLRGSWTEQKCNITGSCLTVSPLWCNNELQKKMFCSQEGYEDGLSHCNLTFELVVEDTSATIHGLDINLYKKEENYGPTEYNMFLVSDVGGNIDTISERTMHSNCSGWQTFHIEEKKVNEIRQQVRSLHSDVDSLNVTIIVIGFAIDTEHTDETRGLSCEEIASLFVLDTTPVVSSKRDSNSEDIDDNASAVETMNKDAQAKTKPTGSGENASSSETPVQNLNNDASNVEESEELEEILDLDIFVPLATLFTKESFDIFSWLRGRREVSMISHTSDHDPLPTTSSDLCELQERSVSFEDPTILAPTSFKQGYCMTPPSLSSKGKWCVPSSFESLYVLRSPQTTHINLELIPDMIVTGCTPSCQLTDREVVLEDYFNTSIILLPHSVNIRQCLLTSGDDERFQCVPDTYEGLDVLLRIDNRLKIDRLSNLVIDSCRVIARDTKLPFLVESKETNSTTIIPPKDMEEDKDDEEVEKTTAITATTDKHHHPDNSVCELQNKMIDLQEIYPSIITPRYANVRECVVSENADNRESVQCTAATYTPLEVVVQNSLEQLQVELLPSVVVSSCKMTAIPTPEESPTEKSKVNDGVTKKESEDANGVQAERPSPSTVTCELQDRVVNVAEYLRNSTIIEPKTFNIRQCSPSPVTSSQCVPCEPVYARLEVLHQVYNATLNLNETFFRAIPNVVVRECRRNPDC